MRKQLDVHTIANNARDIRGNYMAQSLSAMLKTALGALDAMAAKAPLAGHRV